MSQRTGPVVARNYKNIC